MIKFLEINKKMLKMAASNYDWKPPKQNNIILEIKEVVIITITMQIFFIFLHCDFLNRDSL